MRAVCVLCPCASLIVARRAPLFNLLLFCNDELHSFRVVLNSVCDEVIGSGQFSSSTAVQGE